jgi:hypothetical protein
LLSDYGDETYIEATQTSKTCNEVNQNTFDLMDSLENSEHNGYLTAACDILEASMAQNNEQKSQQSQDRDVNIQHRHSNIYCISTPLLHKENLLFKGKLS